LIATPDRLHERDSVGRVVAAWSGHFLASGYFAVSGIDVRRT
jgi:hypothetical protein